MNIHEHQAKELLRRYGVAVPDGEACFTVDAAVATANRLGFPCVVKAQIHAGGRGPRRGGVGRAVAFRPALARCSAEPACSPAEINPLVATADGGLLALAAKIGFDDTGLFRHPELRELRAPSEEDPREQEAAK